MLRRCAIAFMMSACLIPIARAAFKWRKLLQTAKLTNVGANVFHGVDIRIN
jgi:hypothetical protein